MAPRPRLKRSLTDLLADIDANKSLENIIPSPLADPEEHGDGDLNGEFQLIPGKREYRTTFPEVPTEYVEDAKPPKDNYGQGPRRSTRVAVHKFVPNKLEQAGVVTPQTLGSVYVRFQPHINGKHGNDIWRYKNVPKTVYDSFANSNSKGRFINTHLNGYPKGRISSREDRFHTEDF